MADNFYYKSNLYRRIVQAKLFIDAHFSQNININLIADEAYFSKFHFIRLFKSIYHFTPHQYLIQVRINEAKKLLAKNILVEDVCNSVGFESVTSFTGLFRKKVGLSPAAYQKKQISLNNERYKQPLKYIPACHIYSALGSDKI